MKLLDSKKIPGYMNELWHQWSKEIVGEQPMGDFYVFSDGGRFRGVTLEGNKEAATIGGIISVVPSDYKLAKVKEVRYLSFHFNALSSRWQNEVAFLFRGKNKEQPWPEQEKNRTMQHLHKSNPCVVFTLSLTPFCFSGGEKGYIDLQTGAVHTKSFPMDETLPCVYKVNYSDLLYDLAQWETRNEKSVKMNFESCMDNVRKDKEDKVLALGGHLLMVLGKEEADIPQDIHKEHYVHAAFTPDVISFLSASEITEKKDEELYTSFLTKIRQVGYHELYHMGYTGKEK